MRSTRASDPIRSDRIHGPFGWAIWRCSEVADARLAPAAWRPDPRTVVVTGLAITTVGVVFFLQLVQTTSYDVWGAALVGPVLFIATLPAILHQARREADPGVARVAIIGLVLRFVGALARQFVAFGVYGGVADASGYYSAGVRLAHQFRAGDFATHLSPLTGTNFIRLLTGVLYTITGPTLFGGYVFFAWLGFWGVFLFYRAFTVAVPEGRRRTYARLLFFLPSLVFWPSGLGKDAWVVFAIGLMALGGAYLLAGRTSRGMALALVGFWLGWMVRPHIVGMMGIAIACALVIRQPSSRWRELAPMVRVVSLAFAALAVMFILTQSQRFLQESDISTDGVTSALTDISVRTSEGGSEFAAPVVRSPAQLPLATITVLYRPWLGEAHNTQALAVSLETTFLAALTLARIRWLGAGLGSMRRQPYVVAAVAYVLMFIVAFSSIGNFGILARERDQLLPMFLVLLCIPPAFPRGGASGARRASIEPGVTSDGSTVPHEG
jgi:hypothetical protein